jgi:hypothetical protein
MLVAPARDLRLDVLRGWMQVSIFISHVVGTQLSWGIHAAWGVSDSSEQFLFLSGFTLGSVFALKASRMGETAAARDLGGRTLRLYATQMKLFLAFMALVMLSCWLLPWAGQLDKLGWRFLVEHPWQAIPGAAAMLYQPSFLGILPSFVFSMLLLAPFLWLHARIGAWALLPSGALWAAVQAGWIATPGIGPDGLAFDPLAWQFLYMIGATMGVRALHGRPLPRHWLLLVLAAAVVLGGLVQALRLARLHRGVLLGARGGLDEGGTRLAAAAACAGAGLARRPCCCHAAWPGWRVGWAACWRPSARGACRCSASACSWLGSPRWR